MHLSLEVGMTTIEEIKERHAKAIKEVPLPWEYLYPPEERMGYDIKGVFETDCGSYPPQKHTAEFILHSVTDIPLLIRALELACKWVCPRSIMNHEIKPLSIKNQIRIDNPNYWLEQAQNDTKKIK
jgi:hypothetical protein